MTPSGLVTLTTDFGAAGGYVGALRGVLLSHDPRPVLADITHDITPFSIMEGALALRAAALRFPAGTVHLAVVDPGVGGARRPIVVSSGGHHFVGPDNGLFTPFLDGATVVVLDRGRLGLPEPSPTFHGRDLFAPVAARLAGGEAPGTLGARIDDPVRLDWPLAVRTDDGMAGVVLHIDRFGNAITNGTAGQVAGCRHVAAGRERDIPIVTTYADARPGDVVALVGSGGLLEVAVVEGSAAERLGLAAGSPVVARRG